MRVTTIFTTALAVLFLAGMASAGEWVQTDSYDFMQGTLTGTTYDHGSVHLDHAPVRSWRIAGTEDDGGTGETSGPAGDVNGDGYDDVFVATASGYSWTNITVYHGGPWGLSRIPDWTVTNNDPGEKFGATAAGAGHVNGDGYDDLLVGAWKNDSAGTDAGQVRLFNGSGSGLLTEPGWVANGGAADNAFGLALSGAGDVNGDGLSDFIVSEPWSDEEGSGAGKVHLFLGNRKGPNATSDWNASNGGKSSYYGRLVSGAGDVNGDGYDDFLVGCPYKPEEGMVHLYLGSASQVQGSPSWNVTGETAGDDFGDWVQGLGDVNGDGFDDVFIGASDSDEGGESSGKCYVYHGSASGPSPDPVWTTLGPRNYSYLGVYSSFRAGDINGDGFNDLLVNSPNARTGWESYGIVQLYLGGGSGLTADHVWRDTADDGYEFYAYTVGGAGDVDGDGMDEFLVYGRSDEYVGDGGKLYLYEINTSLTSTPIEVLQARGEANANNGGAIDCGDIDGDGHDELISGAFSTNEVYIYEGTRHGIGEVPTWTLSGTSGEYFGNDVAFAGDVNGDGFGDVLIGAPLAGGGSATGSAYIYYGSESGIYGYSGPDWTYNGTYTNEYLGYDLCAAGDVNGDGYHDVIVGSHYNDSQTGRFNLFFGSRHGPGATPNYTYEGAFSGESFGEGLDGVGDVNGDGFDDFVFGSPAMSSYDGYLRLYLGPDPASYSVAWGTSSGASEVGAVVSGAGDVNGDGYSDFIASWQANDTGGVDAGAAVVYYGSEGGITDSTFIRGWTAGDELGYKCSGAGDMDGDGYDDIVLGESENNTIHVFRGSSRGISTTPWYSVSRSNSYFGHAITSGDASGDHIPEIYAASYTETGLRGNQGIIFGFAAPERMHHGVYTSSTFSSSDGTPSMWRSISVDATVPDGTTLLMQIGTSEDGVNWHYFGPDGTPSTTFEGEGIHSIPAGTGSTFWCYRVEMYTDLWGVTPTLDEVKVQHVEYQPPEITLHSPNGGEDLMENGSHVITWTSSAEVASGVMIEYSTDGGVNWTFLDEVEDTGHFKWTVPGTETAIGLVRVTAWDRYGNAAMDVSDMTFAIDPPANWQLPGTGGDGGTGDDGTGDDGPGTSDDQPSTEDATDVGPLWIAIAAEGLAIALLTIFLLAMMTGRRKGGTGRR